MNYIIYRSININCKCNSLKNKPCQCTTNHYLFSVSYLKIQLFKMVKENVTKYRRVHEAFQSACIIVQKIRFLDLT